MTQQFFLSKFEALQHGKVFLIFYLFTFFEKTKNMDDDDLPSFDCEHEQSRWENKKISTAAAAGRVTILTIGKIVDDILS